MVAMEKNTIFRNEIFQYVQENYSVTPQYLWEKYPNYAVFKHPHNQKWFGCIVDLPRTKLSTPPQNKQTKPDDIIDILVVKADPAAIPTLLHQEGYLPAYYMNKSHWISICLDGTIDKDEIYYLLNESYNLTKK